MLFIDGDVVKYRAAFGAQRNVYTVEYRDPEFDEDVVIPCDNKREANEVLASSSIPSDSGAKIVTTEVVQPVSYALSNVDSIIESIMKACGHTTEDTVICLSGATNFRDRVAVTREYKGNRPKDRNPIHGQACVLHMIDKYECEVSEDEEADDVMGRNHYQIYREDPTGTIIATIDKDLDMIPGLHYDFVKEKHYFVNEEEAEKNFLRQLITGDTTDNIPGLPKKGPAFAAKVEAEGLLNMETIQNYYVIDYGEEKGQEVFDEMRELLWIRRDPKIVKEEVA